MTVYATSSVENIEVTFSGNPVEDRAVGWSDIEDVNIHSVKIMDVDVDWEKLPKELAELLWDLEGELEWE